jgi:glycosyltransferase involved in cell wall biosynthesis
MPRTVLEAAAAGVPLVVSEVGSVVELIEDGRSGRVVAPGDVEAMAAAILELRRDPAGARRLGAGARDRVEPFSAGRMRRELAELWSEVADRSTGRRAEQPDRGSSVAAGPSRLSRPAP